MTTPEPETETNIHRIIPILGEMLKYVMGEALVKNEPGCLSYDCDADEVTYHYKPSSLDRSLFDTLIGVEEIWIITKGCTES